MLLTWSGSKIAPTAIVAIPVSILAGLVPLDGLADLTSIGTLAAFTVVSASVIILRRREPDLPRAFKVPGYPVTPILSIAACIFVMSGLQWITFALFIGWVGVVLIFYFTYGINHSKLEHAPQGDEVEAR